MNLEMFAPPPPQREFFCHTPVDRTGMAAFAALVRAQGDPERSPRPDKVGGRDDKRPHLTIKKTSLATWRERIVEHLTDGVARTMNRLSVEMIDQTADTVFRSPFEAALWGLVGDGLVEHTMEIPVLFRRAACDCG